MWQRIKRMVRSNLGRLNDLKGPGDALKGEQQQLEKGLAEVQKSIAELKGQLHVLEEKQRKATRREPELKALVEAAQQRSSTDLVIRYTSELETVRADQTSVVRQLAIAREALEKGERARATFVEALARKKAEIQEHRRVLAELEAEDAGSRTNHDADLALARAGLLGDLGPTPTSATPPPGVAPPAPRTGAPGLQSPVAPPAFTDDGHHSRPGSKTIGVEATPPSGIATPVAGPKTIGASPETPPTGAPAAGGKTIGPIVVTPAQVAAAQVIAAPEVEAPKPIEKIAIKVRPLVATPPAPAQDTPASSAPRDVVGELERLAALHAAGALTDDEMAQAKKRLLGGL